MKQNIAIVLLFVLNFSFAQTNFKPLSFEEKFQIDNYQNQEMRVMKKTNHCDSILLKSNSIDIDPNDPHTLKLFKQMLLTVQHPDNDGVGIAAPQVGINRRLFISQRFDKPQNPFEVFINPVIVNQSDTYILGPEGDLSFDERGLVYRNEWIDVVYIDQFGSKVEERISGFSAVIFQHERDHLDGILLVDRIEEQQNLNFKKLNENSQVYKLE